MCREIAQLCVTSVYVLCEYVLARPGVSLGLRGVCVVVCAYSLPCGRKLK